MRPRAAVYLVFAITGVGLTLPGALLPVLLRHWSLTDSQGGLLLFLFYFASAFGALLLRGQLRFALVRTATIAAVGSAGVALAGRFVLFPAIAVFGLGVGATISGVSLLQSRRFPATRRLELTRLNLVWALGAACGPWIALRATRNTPIVHAQHVLLAVAVVFLAVAAWSMRLEPDAAPVAMKSGVRGRLAVPFALMVLLFCCPGVDAATNGWLTTFAQRTGDTLGTTIGAATCLWLGSLLSRILHSTSMAARWSERSVLRLGCLGMAVALALLVAFPNGDITMAAAALLGFAAGPVYPLLIALALRDREDTRIFLIAGVGASALPLMTGQLSAMTHSLRVGLGVPLAAACLMLGMSFFQARTSTTRPTEVA
jgi:FHS family glucose/mannose:H+ symporter-like MFS transporter